VSSYRLRVEALLLKEEFNQTVDWLKPSIDAVIISARGLNSTLYVVLLAASLQPSRTGPAFDDTHRSGLPTCHPRESFKN